MGLGQYSDSLLVQKIGGCAISFLGTNTVAIMNRLIPILTLTAVAVSIDSNCQSISTQPHDVPEAYRNWEVVSHTFCGNNTKGVYTLSLRETTSRRRLTDFDPTAAYDPETDFNCYFSSFSASSQRIDQSISKKMISFEITDVDGNKIEACTKSDVTRRLECRFPREWIYLPRHSLTVQGNFLDYTVDRRSIHDCTSILEQYSTTGWRKGKRDMHRWAIQLDKH